MSTQKKPVWKPLNSLPVGLDLSPCVRQPWRDYGEWVVSQVVRQGKFYHRAPDQWVPLSQEYLIRHISQKVRRPLLDSLISGGVIECDWRYQYNPKPDQIGKCYYYRLAPKWQDVPVKSHPITHLEVLRKIFRHHQHERDSQVNPVHLHLRQWHDQLTLSPTTPYGLDPLLDAVLYGERRFTVCEMGRVHTNLTNLPRWSRKFVQLGDQPMVSLDICTSQPLLLSLLIARHFNIPTNLSTKGQGGGRGSLGAPNPPGGVQTPSVGTSFHQGTSDYLTDCLTGEVYDKVRESIPGVPYTRDEVKPLLLAVLYGRPDHMGTKVGLAFRKLYPAVFDATVRLYGELGHGGLPRMMQRAESDVMILKVCGWFLLNRPRMPLGTIHDCLVVPKGYEGLADEVIKSTWQDTFGVEPRTKISSF